MVIPEFEFCGRHFQGSVNPFVVVIVNSLIDSFHQFSEGAETIKFQP